MTNIYLQKGDTLHIPDTGPDHDPKRGHLHIILTDECPDGKHLLVSVSSLRPKCDNSCLLGKGDHPFITRDSFISYAHADIYDARVIKERIKKGDITHRGQLESHIFGFVCAGVTISRLISPIKKNYYLANK